MTRTDRAFRALAMEKPEAITALLELCAPGLLPPGATLHAEDVDAPSLIAPPSLEADCVARVGDELLLHVEAQGYRDDDFLDRLFRYHLGFVLRYPHRKVLSVALWLTPPPSKQRVDRIRRRGVEIRVRSLVLRELSAARLLSRRETVCFAAGAHRGDRSDEQLCSQVAAALGEDPTERKRALALALAMMAGRYGAMMNAMKQAELELPIIEDFVRFGEDRGIAKGRAEGEAKGRAEGEAEGEAKGRAAAVLSVLRARGLNVSRDEEQLIQGCSDLKQLDEWTRRAVCVESADELFG